MRSLWGTLCGHKKLHIFENEIENYDITYDEYKTIKHIDNKYKIVKSSSAYISMISEAKSSRGWLP